MTSVPPQSGPPPSERGGTAAAPYRGPERRTVVVGDPATARLTALSRAAARIVAARSVQDVAAVAVRAGVEAVGAGGGTVAVRDDLRGVVRLSSTEHYNPELVAGWPELSLDAPLPIAHTARTGERLLLPSRARALERFPAAGAHQALTDEWGTPIVAAAVLPLSVSGRLLGSLTLTWPHERVFATGDLDLLDALAVLVGQALDRVASQAERDRALGRERLLARSGELLRAGLDPDAVLDAVVGLVRPDLAEAAWVVLADGRLHGDPLVAADPGGRAEARLVADGEVLGTLVCARPFGPVHTPEELALIRAVADRAALALAHALLFAEQRDTSVALQRALLTEPPEPDHLHVVVRYQPATHAAVGGDWYDAFITRDGTTVLVIGDVVGHDAQAAAAMGQLRGLLRAVAYVLDAPPAAVLSSTEHAASGLSVTALATAVVARIESATGPDGNGGGRVLRWTNAGHLPPVVVAADGSATLLAGVPDLMLGIDPEAARSDHEHPLADGDTVLLYTDGLVERRDRDLDAGLDELVRHLTELATLPPDALCDALLARMLPDGTEDDVALVAVRAHREDRPRPASAGPNRLPGR